jgi:hypothetical protein
MKYVGWLALSLAIAGCGGGGGGGGGGGAGGLTPEETAVLARSILEDCQAGQIDAVLENLEPIRDLLTDQTPNPPAFEITSLDLVQANVGWAVDLDNDGTDDVTGVLRIRDAAGNPAWPVDLAALLGGDLDLLSALGTIADGTRLLFEFDSTFPVTVTGTLTAVVSNGEVATVEGSGEARSGGCVSMLQFSPIGFANIEGDYPVADMDMTVQSGQGALQGTATLDGSHIAVVEVTVDGGQGVHTLLIDMETGTVTPLASQN